jgi:hypothetical protein
MASLKDSVASELSELRNMVLGAQIFLGFQYEALFMPRFHAAAAAGSALYVGGLATLIAALIFLVAPTAHHRLAEHGDATRAQSRFAGLALGAGAFLFALALGLDVAFALGVAVAHAWMFAILVTSMALFAWFILEFTMRSKTPPPPRESARLTLKQTLSELMSESRIVLPGVQALLGFQLAAYLSDGFARLAPSAQLVHHAALGLLLVSMILLMAPAPFHRIAERGIATRRAEIVGVWMVMSGLALLALGLAGDFYVALVAVTHNEGLAVTGASIAAGAAFFIWFVYPLSKRAHDHGPRSRQTSPQS